MIRKKDTENISISAIQIFDKSDKKPGDYQRLFDELHPAYCDGDYFDDGKIELLAEKALKS